MTPCERYKQLILNAVDQKNQSKLSEELRTHLDQCKACDQLYQSLLKLKKGLKRLQPVNAPESFQVVLRDRIRREMAGKTGLHFEERSRRVPAPLAITAAVIFIAGSLYFGQSMIHESLQSRAGIKVMAEKESADLIFYVIDDFDLHAFRSGKTAISRLDSLILQDRSTMQQANIQPVSF